MDRKSKNCRKPGKKNSYEGAVIIYDQDGGRRDIGGGLKKYSIQRRVIKKFSF